VKHERHVAEADYPSEAQGTCSTENRNVDRTGAPGAGTAGAGTVILSPAYVTGSSRDNFPYDEGSFSPLT